MNNELLFIKDKFNENLKQYKKHFKNFEKIENYETKWSYSTSIDFYPYESSMYGFKPSKLYNTNPLSENSKETIIQNRFRNKEIFYSFNYHKKEWGSEFYFDDEKNNKMRLFYEDQNEEGKILLSQLKYKIIDKNIVKKVYSYMYDHDMEKETFFIFDYFYEQNKIIKIVRSDYFKIHPVVIFDKTNNFNIKKIKNRIRPHFI